MLGLVQGEYPNRNGVELRGVVVVGVVQATRYRRWALKGGPLSQRLTPWSVKSSSYALVRVISPLVVCVMAASSFLVVACINIARVVFGCLNEELQWITEGRKTRVWEIVFTSESQRKV
jgi:hypothetical protein